MSKVISVGELKQKLGQHKGSSIGFVPTMGALHDGHLSLIKQAKEENDVVVVSIFVNPTQFLEGEDFSRYPKKEEADLKICELVGVDYVFLPQVDEIYQKDEISVLANSNKAYILEGFNRPGHFDGVLQVVLKLFNMVTPSNAYFGKKDAQQLYFVKNMVKKLFLPVNIVECDIVRDIDGLAKSSRNVYLTKEQREQALSLSASLKYCTSLIQKGEMDSKVLKEEIRAKIDFRGEIEYVEVVDLEFNPLKEIEFSNTIVLLAVKFDKVRLLDNFFL